MSDIHSDLADKVAYLCARWNAERNNEDFADYVEHMQQQMPEGAKVTKMTKRPFRVEYTMADGTRRWIKSTTKSVEWGGYVSVTH